MPDLVQTIPVYARRADVSAKTINGQDAERKQNAPAKIRHIKHIANCGKKLIHWVSCMAQALACVL
jgi:hypothetical protein